MADAPYIPRATQAELNNPAPEGDRHHQAVKIACSLAGNGHNAGQIFEDLRKTYPADLSDDELKDIATWAASQNFQPSHVRTKHSEHGGNGSTSTTTLDPVEQFVDGLMVSESDLIADSPVAAPDGDKWTTAAALLVETLYQTGENLNIVVAHADNGKPKGYGTNIDRDKFLARLVANGAPPNDAGGAWLRMNPTDGNGIADRNITTFGLP